ncbi:MAG: glutamate decarboxylase [Firmicutes bacterium]|nr:glutamate decarboxylase [Bacillota bacterium]
MWQVVYIARDKQSAEELQAKLQAEGVMANIRPLGNEGTSQYEILVPESELEEAHEVLTSV